MILFEGRDAAGKGGTIQRFMEHLNPRGARVVALEKPSEREETQWYFQRYIAHLPAGGRDRAVRPVLVQPRRRRKGDGILHRGATRRIHAAGTALRAMLVDNGISLTKFWFSVSPAEQRTRFAIRQVDPVRQWKLSPMDMASLDKWDEYTAAKEEMFEATDTEFAPWIVVKSNDKKRARINAMRYVLAQSDYDNKDHEVVGEPDPLIVGRALTD